MPLLRRPASRCSPYGTVTYITGDPKLGPLQDNGGLTQTLALLPGSPAIDQANTDAFRYPSDQRGARRSIVSQDIGAFDTHVYMPQAISFGTLGDRTYGDADFAIVATTSSLLPVRFTATGDASVRQVGGVWYVHITGAGSATITAIQAGNDDYEPASAVSQTFTIAKAASVTTTVGAGPFTYNGGPQIGGSGTVTGAGGLNTGASWLTYSANGDGTGVADRTNAGTYYVTAHYAGDANHSASYGAAVAIVIGKADATVNVSGYSGVYDAAYHGATGSASGVGGEGAGTLDLGAAFRNIAGGTAHWVFTGNRNYKDQSGDVAIRISARHVIGGFTSADKGYDDNASATVLTRSLTGILGADDVSLTGGTATFASKDAGTWTVNLDGATLAGGDAGNYVLDSVATTAATITPRALTGSAAAELVLNIARSGTLSFRSNYVLDSIARSTASITRRALTRSATREVVLNIARDGTLSFRIDPEESGIVDGRSIAQLFDGARFSLAVSGRTYNIRARADVGGDNIIVGFPMSGELKAILAANARATNAGEAPTVALTLEARSAGGNYSLKATARTKLFNTTERPAFSPGASGLPHGSRPWFHRPLADAKGSYLRWVLASRANWR